MLEHPIRWKNQQTACPRRDGYSNVAEYGLATFLYVVEVPEENEIAVGLVVDCVEMR